MVHDIATPRRTIGGRCRKWCISTSCLRETQMCYVEHDSLTVKHVTSNGEITNHHYVHAHCVNGGLGQIMSGTCLGERGALRME